MADPENKQAYSLTDYFSVALSTCGVGFIPLAPGTWGSVVGVGIFLLARWGYQSAEWCLIEHGKFSGARADVWLGSAMWVVFILFCWLGIWAAGRTAKLFGDKDPQKVVVDEVMGQLLVFFFVPLGIAWWMILLGFGLFRFFDISKVYPIDDLQHLPGGLGVCADDLMGGVYAGVCLNIIYAISLNF